MEDKDKLSEKNQNKTPENDLDFDLSSFDLDNIKLNTNDEEANPEASVLVDNDTEDVQTQTKPRKKGKKILRAWLRTFLFVIIFTLIIRAFVFEIYVIPNNNMGSTLKSTDYVWVNKFAYGARLPKTFLHIPFTHQNIWGTNIPSYTELFSTSDKNYGRFWGFTQPQKQDILVFGLPQDTLHPIDLKDNAIGRCVAVAGDTLRLVNGKVEVNGKIQNEVNTLEKAYLFANELNVESSLASQNIDLLVSKNQITAIGTQEKMDKVAKKTKVKYQKIMAKKGMRNPNIIPKHPDFTWNEDNLGPLVIPKKGVKIPLSKHNVALYADVIINHDILPQYEVKKGVLVLSKVVLKDDKLMMQTTTFDEKKITKQKTLTNYTFQQNYYFALSDRRYGTIDSRHFGFIPQNHIIGKADLVLLSYQGEKTWYNPLGWNRWFLNVK